MELHIGQAIPETLNFIAKYSSQLSFFALSNSNVLHRQVWSVLFKNELSFFQNVYCSSLIKARKPEARAYNHVLKDSGLRPDEVLFVDDRIENIQATKQLGIESVLFNNPRKAIEGLESLLTL